MQTNTNVHVFKCVYDVKHVWCKCLCSSVGLNAMLPFIHFSLHVFLESPGTMIIQWLCAMQKVVQSTFFSVHVASDAMFLYAQITREKI